MNIYVLLWTLNRQAKVIFAYNKTHYGEATLAKIGKLEETITKYLSFTIFYLMSSKQDSTERPTTKK